MVDCITLDNTAVYKIKVKFIVKIRLKKKRNTVESHFFKPRNGKRLGKLADRFVKVEGKFLLFLPRELKIALNDQEVQNKNNNRGFKT